jgi:hypothetical protein
MKYQGNTDARMQCLGLDRAMYNWSVWPDIEDNIHQNLLTKIRGLFSLELFTEIMVESGLTHKALRAIKAIDEYGIFSNVTSTNICKHLKGETMKLCKFILNLLSYFLFNLNFFRGYVFLL